MLLGYYEWLLGCSTWLSFLGCCQCITMYCGRCQQVPMMFWVVAKVLLGFTGDCQGTVVSYRWLLKCSGWLLWRCYGNISGC